MADAILSELRAWVAQDKPASRDAQRALEAHIANAAFRVWREARQGLRPQAQGEEALALLKP